MQISLAKLPKNAKGPLKLSLRLSSTASGDGLVYFKTPKNQRFGKAQTVPLPVTHDGAMHEYELALPDGVESLAALRLDPATAPGQIVIERIELRDASGKRHQLHSEPSKP